VTGGTGSTFVEQAQAQIAGQGQIQPLVAGRDVGFVGTGLPHAARVAQSRTYRDFEAIPVAAGSEGSVTLANINTALTNAVTALAGASGTPLISPAELAIIQNWAAGGT
ncbi:MAG TPA: hypothetical protein VF764_05410, partial [Steroidobacteraceae bacterium]